MCGHFGGISTYLSAWEVSLIQQLGFVSSLRGTDSTGIAVAHSKWGGYKPPTVEVMKDVYCSPDFLSFKETTDLMTKKNIFSVIGHCRAATFGKVSKENAHPFTFKHITGAHNGTCSSFNPAPGDLVNKDRSDSYMLFKNLAENGIQNTVDKAGHGAYALVWFDMKQKSLNMLRNSQRPLFLMYAKDDSTLLWASEKIFLEFVVKRTNSNNWKEPVQLPEDKHLIIDMLDSKFVGDMTAVARKPVCSIQQGNTGLYKNRYRQNQEREFQRSPFLEEKFWNEAIKEAEQFKEDEEKKVTAVPATSVPTAPAKKLNLTEELHATCLGYNKISFNIRYILRYLGNGCATCGDKRGIIDTTWWFSKTDYVCNTCMNKKKPFLTWYLKDRPMYEAKIQGNLSKELAVIEEEKSANTRIN